jgi:hypothetical protein
LTVNDKDIIVANNVTGSANVDGAGIQAGNPGVATWFYNNATLSWQSNVGVTPTTNGTLSLGGASNFWGNAFLTTASVTGNVQGGNIRTAGLVSATGAITGASVVGGVMTGSSVSVTGAVTGASVVGGVMTGTSVSVTGNVAGGNIATAGLITATGNITGNYIFGNGSQLTGISGGGTPGQTNITSVGTLSALSVTGNVQGGNIRTAGLISATGAVTGAALTGSSLTVTTGNITAGNLLISGAIIDSAQLDIQTSAANANIVLTPNGTGNVNLVRLSASGNITGGNIITSASGGNITGANVISATTISTSQIINSGANGVGNIGSSTTYFNTVFAKATSAQYADLAEMYAADKIFTYPVQ